MLDTTNSSTDWTPFIGQEIPLMSDYWLPSGHKIMAIVVHDLEDTSNSIMTEARSFGYADLILGDGSRIKTSRTFTVRDGVALFRNSKGLFQKRNGERNVEVPIIDRVLEMVRANGQWILPSVLDEYRTIELDSDLGRILLEPFIAEFGTFDALKDAPVITAVKEPKSTSTGSVGWGHRSVD